jgi:hypothetical protein
MTPPLPIDEAPPAPVWRGFVRQHLFDYPPPARRVWLAIVSAGGLALGWALWDVVTVSTVAALPLLLALGLVALASALALKLPRTAYSLSASDVFVFGVLAALGPAAAVLAAGVDGVVGTLRNSKRLSSRVSTPAAAMAAMAMAVSSSCMTRSLLAAKAARRLSMASLEMSKFGKCT